MNFEKELKFLHNDQIYLVNLEIDYTVNGQNLPPTAEEPAEGIEIDDLKFKVLWIDDLDGPIDDPSQYREIYTAFALSPNSEDLVYRMAVEDYNNQ